jgi:predicted nuclease of predicted toxin-antitoxin system
LRFLLDACVASRSLQSFLTGAGHDVALAGASRPSEGDGELIARAMTEDRILVTEDKDFGELIFVERAPHGTIIRLVGMTVAAHVEAMNDLLVNQSHELTGPALITVTHSRIRIRR